MLPQVSLCIYWHRFRHFFSLKRAVIRHVFTAYKGGWTLCDILTLQKARFEKYFLSLEHSTQGIPHICHFFYTGRIHDNQILHPQKTTKGTKNTKNVSEKVKCMHFFHSIWKKLHLTENFYTDMSVVSVTNMRYGFPFQSKKDTCGWQHINRW